MQGKKTGGRQKNTPNKITSEVKEAITLAIAGHVKRIPEYLEQIADPERKLNALVKLLPYVVPRMQAVVVKEVTTLEEFISMSPEKRLEKIKELKQQMDHG